MSLTVENNILMKNGKPFFYLADTCWSAFTNITDNDWDYYLDYRKSQGFNTLQINILPQWDASATDLCYEPFEVIDGKYNYKKINLSYFEHADKMCARAKEKGFEILYCTEYVDEFAYLIKRNFIQSLRKSMKLQDKKFVYQFIDDIFDVEDKYFKNSNDVYHVNEEKGDDVYLSRIKCKLYYALKRLKNGK